MTQPKATVYGWLWKRGSGFKTWKKRFFVLKQKELVYYEQCVIVASAAAASGTRILDLDPKGSLLVNDVEESDKTEFGLCIHSPRGRKLLVQADSATTRQEWLSALKRAASGIDLEPASEDGVRDTVSTSSSNDPGSPLGRRRRNSLTLHCDKSGWLMKKGKNVHTWKKRYFVVKGHEVSYHSKDSQTSPPLNSGRISHVEYWSGKQFGLVVTLNSGRELYINTESDEDRSSWLMAFQNAISARDKKKFSPK